MNALADVQSSQDLRNLPINQVGIKALRLPITLRTTEGEQTTVARLDMTVHLPADQKGTHMSRFVALMEQQTEPLTYGGLKKLTADMLALLNAHSGKITVSFPFFRRKAAPVSGIQSYLDYDVEISGEFKQGDYSHSLKVMAPVTSLCPCSKEISQYGAHNQRSHVTVTLSAHEEIGIEEVVDYIEAQGSSQLYGLLKRPDEKFVTEYAYDNPKFVEDIVRDVAAALKADDRICQFIVESENFESIHNHSAYAKIVYP